MEFFEVVGGAGEAEAEAERRGECVSERAGKERGRGLERFFLTQSPRFDKSCLTSLITHHPNLEELGLNELGKMEDGWLVPASGGGVGVKADVRDEDGEGEEDRGEGEAEVGAENENENETSAASPPRSTPTPSTLTISSLTHLTTLSLTSPPYSLTNISVCALLKSIGARIEILNLSGNEKLTNDVLLDGLVKYCRSLRSLKISGVGGIDDLGVVGLFNGWSGISSDDDDSSVLNPITSLDLSRNPLLSNRALSSLITFFSPSSGRPALRHLNINSWKDLSSESLMELAGSDVMCGLEELDVSWCREVDGFFMKDVVERSGGLKWIKCYGCNKLGSDCPKRVSSICLSILRAIRFRFSCFSSMSFLLLRSFLPSVSSIPFHIIPASKSSILSRQL